MANVWFAQRVGAVWKTVGSEPAYRRPLEELVFKLDLGPQRRQATEEAPERDDLGREVDAHTRVFVEVLADDVDDARFRGYFPGWYDSPYAAPAAIRRLD
jgi:hypothetical protein